MDKAKKKGLLIILEGIDGSGKTSITKKIVEMLHENGESVIQLSRKNPHVADVEVQKYLDMLKSIVWYKKADGIPWAFLDQTQWLVQLALWYSVLENQYIGKLQNEYDYLIIDGWFYKLYARSQYNKTVRSDLVEFLLEFLQIESNVFLLKNEPSECWKRRTCFKKTEIAPYNEDFSDPYSSYVEFQDKVQNIMIEMSEKKKWNIIECKNKTIDDIAAEIIACLHTKL